MALTLSLCCLLSIFLPVSDDRATAEKLIQKLQSPHELVVILRRINEEPGWKTFAENDLEFTSEQITALNNEWHRLERQIFATKKEISKWLPIPSKPYVTVHLAAYEIFGETSAELIREEQRIPLAKCAFQISFALTMSSLEMENYLKLSEPQRSAIKQLNGGRGEPKLPEEKRKLIKKCESTEGKILLLLDRKQQKLVRKLLGKPIPGSWLKEVDDLKEENEKVLEAEEKETK